MELDFTNKDTKSLCEDERLAQRKLGADCARKLRARIADLRAARTVSDLVVGNPHPLKRDRAGQFSIRLHAARRLVFESNMSTTPCAEDGSIMWPQVDSVTIVFIGDYHD